MARKPPFTVSLTDEERQRLEAHRARLGLRSLADVIRHWIELGGSSEVWFVSPGKTGELSKQSTKTWGEAINNDLATMDTTVPLLQRKPFNPQPKKR